MKNLENLKLTKLKQEELKNIEGGTGIKLSNFPSGFLRPLPVPGKTGNVRPLPIKVS